MRFGGHQTFTIRDGWLYKGLELLVDKKERYKLVDDFAMDYLGVGRNMAKSINHWLLATKLAEKEEKIGKSGNKIKTKDLIPTELANIFWQEDPFFSDIGTWWFIHTSLVNSPDDAATWKWFFNSFAHDRFQKEVALQALYRSEKLQTNRKISLNTLDRDLSCFLNSYAVEIPSKNRDPEDEIESPLVDLELIKYYRGSGYYQINRGFKDIPFSVFMYALSFMELDDTQIENGTIEFFQLVTGKNGPGKIFLLSNEDLFELLRKYEAEKTGLKMLGLAGERVIQFPKKENRMGWVKEYYTNEVSS